MSRMISAVANRLSVHMVLQDASTVKSKRNHREVIRRRPKAKATRRNARHDLIRRLSKGDSRLSYATQRHNLRCVRPERM